MKSIIVRSRFSALHMYEDAPHSVSFLKHPHRHMFHVEVEIRVSHGNRDIEFFSVKYAMDSHTIQCILAQGVLVGTVYVLKESCEDIAEYIAQNLAHKLGIPVTDIKYVEVSEDGENAGRYYPE